MRVNLSPTSCVRTPSLTVTKVLAGLSEPPVIACPGWEVDVSCSRPPRLCCDACSVDFRGGARTTGPWIYPPHSDYESRYAGIWKPQESCRRLNACGVTIGSRFIIRIAMPTYNAGVSYSPWKLPTIVNQCRRSRRTQLAAYTFPNQKIIPTSILR